MANFKRESFCIWICFVIAFASLQADSSAIGKALAEGKGENENSNDILETIQNDVKEIPTNSTVAEEIEYEYNVLESKLDKLISLTEKANGMLKSLPDTVAKILSSEIQNEMPTEMPTETVTDVDYVTTTSWTGGYATDFEDTNAEGGELQPVVDGSGEEGESGEGEYVPSTPGNSNTTLANAETVFERLVATNCLEQGWKSFEPTTTESPDECEEICRNHTSCVAFMYKPNVDVDNCQPTNYCTLTNYNVDVDLYFKRPPIYEVPGYNLYRDHDCLGENFFGPETASSIEECEGYCDSYCPVFQIDTRRDHSNCIPRDEWCNLIPAKGIHTYKVAKYDTAWNTKCSKGTDSFKLGKKYYKMFRAPRTWQGGERTCQNFWCNQAHLAEVRNNEDHIFIQAIMRIYRNTHAIRCPSKSFWVGGHLTAGEGIGMNGTNRQYTWAQSKQTVGDFWADGEPNEWRSGDHYCTIYTDLENGGYQLHDENCANYNCFVCELHG